MRETELLIIGGGSAGMAAAVSAREAGVQDIMIIERSGALGGVLNQCIHNGFGLHRYKEELTGPEYAKRNIDKVKELGIPYLLNSFVINLTADKVATIVNPEQGLIKVKASAIILAMGCRERARGALLLPGTRPAGILTAGTAQRYLNLQGYLPGKEAVILGSGDIGLIMARQLVLEGVKVKEVVEIMPYSGGLTRNISQCLNDFNIPLSLSTTVVEIKGRKRVEAIVVAKVDENRNAIPGTEREIKCDTLLISAGLIPENELTQGAGIEISVGTKGAVVDEKLETSLPGVFACGNVLHVHDLVDHVSEEGDAAGRNAAAYIENLRKGAAAGEKRTVVVKNGWGAGAVVPQFISADGPEDEKIRLMFRPRNIYHNASIGVYNGEEKVASRKAMVLAPGEMCEILVDRSKIGRAKELLVKVEV